MITTRTFRRNILPLTALLTIALISAGCDFLGFGSDPPLADTTWELETLIRNGESVVLSPQNTYEIAFSSESVGAVADCNECSGTYNVDDSEISILLFCTESECAPPTRSLLFSNALLGANEYQVSDDELTIEYAISQETSGTLVFRRAQ